ncbi:Electron transfer flavoprotein subunit alpha [Sulfitobacter sp. DSM 110093]|uniref:electron transfer flavoprotein subunit alpha/FixB family protein n=1 Tax=Sulfitobacter sp. DSM 110093 TaxID=2883127 RepID=UPI001FAD0A9C|nr:FAD-binding protein [Sulfitobacter sp. DSM 110093]UOA30544.1 Electron transfer flavoprotein subunit alpha [Sulfitobacter sp. DSM 110093]
MSVLLIAETTDGALAFDATAKAVTALAPLGEITLLIFGVPDAAALAAQISGVTKVLLAEDDTLSHGLAEPTAALVQSIAADNSHIAAPATTRWRNVLPRLAALLDVMIIPDVIEVIDAETFRRPIYAGNALRKVQSSDPIKVLTLRTAGFDAAEQTQAPAPVETLTIDLPAGPSRWIEDRVAKSDRPELTSASVVVSGGRGVGSEEDFALISGLADTLGAAVGASRAAVDSGFAPNDWQVGQTGKVVAPDLYIACGISGAIQHLAGMKDSKVIVAINKDEEAPIFQVADYGLVANLFEAVPELTEQLG